MAYYSSNFYKGDSGEYHSTPPYYTTSYDIVPFQNSISYSNYEFSEPRLSEYNSSAYYGGAYDPFPIPSEINYSTYNPIPYNTNYFSSNTQYTISYSTSTELDDIEFEEYDPTPYGGGYDPTLTYGKPLPPSDEICHPRSLPEPNGVSSDNFSYASIPSPYGNGDIDEQSTQPPKKTKPTEEQPQPNGGTGDNGHDTGHPEKLPDSSVGECYPWSGYDYGVRNEDPNFVLNIKTDQKSKWVVRLSLVEQSPPKSTVDVKRLVGFLYEDLPHLFDDQGIDRTAYDERVKFRDPITKHDSISGYLFNIALLKKLFSPDFELHWVKQTGPFEITTRWTMTMTFILLPWKPELVFTGTSVMGINPETEKFCSHVDYWDSIKNNSYFSLEGLLDVIKQLRIYKTPDLESPKYQILKKTADYEVRKYPPFIVVETNGDKLSGSTGFNAVAGYIFGKNSAKEKMPMTTPVFTQTFDTEMSKVSLQIVLPSEKEMSSLPDPNEEAINLRKVEGGIAAVSKFSGKPTEDVVIEKEKALRSSLIRDGLRPKMGCLLARYNDPGRTWSFMMRNEVLIWLEEFTLG